MQKWCLILCLALATVLPAQGADDPAGLLKETIRAHGGEGALRQWSDQILEGEATVYFGPNEMAASMKLFVRQGAMIRRETRITFGGTAREFVQASTGKSAWRRFGSRVYDHPPDDANTWLRHQPDILLRAAAAPASALKLTGRLDLDGDPVEVVEFTESGETTRIALDAETQLVRWLEYRAMENQGEGVKEEVFMKKVYSDYSPVNGVPFPHRQEEYQEGVKRLGLKVSRVEIGKAPEVSLFAKPAEDAEAREWFDQIAD